jgi:hypothetical protein
MFNLFIGYWNQFRTRKKIKWHPTAQSVFLFPIQDIVHVHDFEYNPDCKLHFIHLTFCISFSFFLISFFKIFYRSDVYDVYIKSNTTQQHLCQIFPLSGSMHVGERLRFEIFAFASWYLFLFILKVDLYLHKYINSLKKQNKGSRAVTRWVKGLCSTNNYE